jgi:hypothetical protein
MRPWTILLPVFVAALLVTPCSRAAEGPVANAKKIAAAPLELLEQKTLYEIVRHLFRWYWDEAEIERAADLTNWVFWVRSVETKLDPGDHSQYAEIFLPQLDTIVHLKKADYMIEELKEQVKSANFHIKNVAKTTIPPQRPANALGVEINAAEMKDYLFRTRADRDYPAPELFERMRGALRKELEEESSMTTNPPVGEQIVYIAPLSPVGNDIWAFWENRKLLIRFASDIDLTDPTVWEHETLMVHVYDPYEQMVISLDEAQGSNRFMTRNQIGRALYNCIVLGQRVTVTARPPPKSQK